MTEFEDYAQGARDIELEIRRKGIALKIDWHDPEQVQALAHEALDHLGEDLRHLEQSPTDFTLRAKVELFGLAALMLREMEESASLGAECHGGEVWKIFAKALWAEKQLRQSADKPR